VICGGGEEKWEREYDRRREDEVVVGEKVREGREGWGEREMGEEDVGVEL